MYFDPVVDFVNPAVPVRPWYLRLEQALGKRLRVTSLMEVLRCCVCILCTSLDGGIVDGLGRKLWEDVWLYL